MRKGVKSGFINKIEKQLKDIMYNKYKNGATSRTTKVIS
jgi:hypothetical protein